MNNKDKSTQEKQFVCCHCGNTVKEEIPCTRRRNHCPLCLRSRHLDFQTGDRNSACGGVMEPIAISGRKDKEWIIIHRCTECGVLRENRIAGDDDETALLSLAVKPIAMPPFPLESIIMKRTVP